MCDTVAAQLVGHEHSRARCRFIPACAGNGAVAPDVTRHPQVHPRVCGERVGERPIADIQIGSSPRVRGTGRFQVWMHGFGRFIPACAGNGPLEPEINIEVSVHPRVCGERAS